MRTPALSFYLTRSRLRTDLLSLFFLNPDRDYYLRELSRKLAASPGTLARELRALSEEGLLEREARGKQVFYTVNSRHPLFLEIKGIIEKTSGIPKALSEALSPLKEIQEAYLYGSIATGEMRANSDIDLLLVGKETDAARKALSHLERKFDRSINSVVYSPQEFEKKRKRKSEFLFTVMESPLIPLKP